MVQAKQKLVQSCSVAQKHIQKKPNSILCDFMTWNSKNGEYSLGFATISSKASLLPVNNRRKCGIGFTCCWPATLEVWVGSNLAGSCRAHESVGSCWAFLATRKQAERVRICSSRLPWPWPLPGRGTPQNKGWAGSRAVFHWTCWDVLVCFCLRTWWMDLFFFFFF